MNTDIRIACRVNTPKSMRSRSALRSTSFSLLELASVSEWKRVMRGFGMNHSTIAMETKASTPVSSKMPDMPMCL